MKKRVALIVGVLFFAAARCNAFAEKIGRPYQLQCEALDTPMGVDTKQPHLSWKLRDERFGARQSAYEILVATRPQLLLKSKADVWDSGRVEADRSIDLLYQGPSLQPETRYYWRVQAWDKDGKPYPASDVSWWETGLQDDANNWRAQWIGYEDLMQRSVRTANPQWITNAAVPDHKDDKDTRHDFRFIFEVTGHVQRAVLYLTGEDSTAAWINSKQVKAAQALPSWGRTPWKTYQKEDVTAEVHSGKNILAIEVMHHEKNSSGQAPMSAALYLEHADGSVEVMKSGDPHWRAMLNATGDWQNADYDDNAWPQAALYAPQKDAFGGVDELANPMPTAAVAVLRHNFDIDKSVVSARLYATALGAYKFSVNGKTVGDQILSPGWTDYRQRVTYQVFDVTPLLQQGENAIGAYLASGWYSTPLEWVGQGNNYGNTPNALKAQLRIQHSDGTAEWIATDSDWKADISPITFAEIYNGETYDARKLQPGWDTTSFSDATWHAVSVIHPHEPEIVWQSFQPIRATEILTAKSISSPVPGTYIYDFGQNLAGVARLNIEGKRGTDVQLRFAEVLNADGSIYVENLRNAKATDHYILVGKGREEYQPSFTFHGFRYVELTGVANPGIDAVHAVVFHTDAPYTARLKTGSSMLNQLWSNILWGQRSNFVGVPTDCPQRDERLGWSADAQVFWRTATYNMDLTAFSLKYAADLRGTQSGTAMYGIYAPGTWKRNPGYGTGWSDAGIIVPWTSWIQTGDLSIIRQNWDGMKSYLDAILSANSNYLWARNYGIAFGDWLAPEGATSEELIATAYWAYDVTLMQQMARAIGKDEEASAYADLFNNIKKAFNKAYVQPSGFVGAALPDKSADPVETQTGYVLALHMNLLADELRSLAADRLVAMIKAAGWKLGTGFLGTPYLLEVLSDTGHADIAYQLLLNTEYPSWGYMVEHGATTMWERWNGDQMRNDPGMNSYNHYAYGAVAEWLYRYAAGIDTVASDPGFHTILLHPHFDPRLGSLEFSYESRYGEIKSSWKDADGELSWTVTIPANTKAALPLTESESQAYTLNGEPITKSHAISKVDKTKTGNLYELGSGVYVFQKR